MRIQFVVGFTMALAACAAGNSAPQPPQPPPMSTETQQVRAPQQTPEKANTNAYVVSLQSALKHKGYYHGRVDGVCGQATQIAARNFQRDKLHLSAKVDRNCHVSHHAWHLLGLSEG